MVVSLLLGLISGTISFENPGIRLELFLKEMSKKSGQGFHCPTYLNNEVLAASFKEQSVDILKTQLARVIHGTWEQKEDGWWLVQTGDQKKEEERWVWEGRNRMLQYQIDGLKAVSPKNEWTIKDAEKYWIDTQASRKTTGDGVWNRNRRLALRLQSPESRFSALLASKLTVKMFTEDPLKLNLNRYSVHGLPGHVELPIDLDSAMTQYAHERQLFHMVGNSKDSDEKPDHVEITYFSGERQFIFVSWLDKEWNTIENALPSIYLPNIALQVQGETFPISNDTKELLAIDKEISSARDSTPVFEKHKSSPIFVDAVSTMFVATKRDPLGIIQGRCWVDFAKSVSQPLLVSLKDDEAINKPPLHVPTLAQSGLVIGMMREDADGWVLGRPINPLFNRSWRVDRSLIEEYARLTKLPSSPNFLPLLRISTILLQIALFSTEIPNGRFLLDDRRMPGDLTAVFGTLGEGQINDCLQGATIPVSALPALGQTFMKYMAVGGSLNDLTPLNISNPGSHSPLYCLPNGAAGITIGAKIQIESEFHFDTEPTPDSNTNLDVESFAYLLKTAEKDSALADMKFKLASKRALVVTAYLGRKSKSEEISEPIFEKDLPTYTWKTLPDSIRQQVLAAMKKLVK